jgi:hypothetical protein
MVNTQSTVRRIQPRRDRGEEVDDGGSNGGGGACDRVGGDGELPLAEVGAAPE